MDFIWASGNHQMRIEEQSSGRAYAQFGELLYPGEICLKPNHSYQSPTLYGATSQQGLNGLSHCFSSLCKRPFN